MPTTATVDGIVINAVESKEVYEQLCTAGRLQSNQIYFVADDTGDGYWRPTVDASGNLSWMRATAETPPATQNIKGPKGDTGETGPQGPQGEQGIQGLAGHTPVRGTDYWTAADRQTIVNETLAALPTYNGEAI